MTLANVSATILSQMHLPIEWLLAMDLRHQRKRFSGAAAEAMGSSNQEIDHWEFPGLEIRSEWLAGWLGDCRKAEKAFPDWVRERRAWDSEPLESMDGLETADARHSTMAVNPD